MVCAYRHKISYRDLSHRESDAHTGIVHLRDQSTMAIVLEELHPINTARMQFYLVVRQRGEVSMSGR